MPLTGHFLMSLTGIETCSGCLTDRNRLSLQSQEIDCLNANNIYRISAIPAISVLWLFVAVCVLHASQPLETRKQETESELEEIRSQIILSEQAREELAAEIARLENDRAAINQNLIDASTRQRNLEIRIDRAGERLAALRGEQAAVGNSLHDRRALLSQVLAALQRMGRKPPPAILVTPQDALSAVRSAIMLGAVVPEIHAESEVLVAELAELVRIENAIDTQRQDLAGDMEDLAEEEERLSLLLNEKKSMTNLARQQLASESAKAAELAAKAINLSRLIEILEAEIASVQEAAEAARAAAEEAERKRREARLETERETAPEIPDFSNMARIAPAIEFENAKGLLPLPVNGVEVQEYGNKNSLGEIAEGLSLATRVNARVTAPADGWVVYAGPFRSYGQLLILNAGSGYHIVLAGMEKIDAQLGQFVLAGEPVAVMGARRIASVETVGLDSSRPVLYVEFRKDGTAIDPSPWWTDTTSKRVADDS
jgi:murein hydrolase activator